MIAERIVVIISDKIKIVTSAKENRDMYSLSSTFIVINVPFLGQKGERIVVTFRQYIKKEHTTTVSSRLQIWFHSFHKCSFEK